MVDPLRPANPDFAKMTDEELLHPERALQPKSTAPAKPSVNLSEFFKDISDEALFRISTTKNVGEMVDIIRNDLQQRSLGGEALAVFQGGLRGIGDVGIGLGALATTAVGADDTTQKLKNLLIERQFETSLRYGAQVPSIEDVKSGDDLLKYIVASVSEQVPNIATVLTGGGVGALIGKQLATRSITTAAGNRLLALTAGNAGTLGIGLTATGIETGATANELLTETGEINVPATLLAGVAKGALESITPALLGKSVGLFDEALQNALYRRIVGSVDTIASRTGRAAAFAARGLTVESATELTQEAVDIAVRSFVDENYQLLGPEARKRLLDAAAKGGIVGFVFGGLGGGLSRQRTKADTTLATVGEEDSFEDQKKQVLLLPYYPEPNTDEPVDGPPSIDPSILPERPDVTEIPNEYTGAPLLAVTGNQLDVGHARFQPGFEGQTTRAFLGELDEQVRTFALKPGVADQLDLSGDLRSLPNTVEEFKQLVATNSSSLVFLDEAKKQEALTEIDAAIRDRNAGLKMALKSLNPESVNKNMRKASEALNNAFELGFRYRPANLLKSSFIAIGGVRADQIEEVNTVEKLLASPLDDQPSIFMQNGKPLMEAATQIDKKLVIPVGKYAQQVLLSNLTRRSLNDNVNKGFKTPLAFNVDFSRIPEHNKFVASATGLASVFQSAGKDADAIGLLLDTLKDANLVEYPKEARDVIISKIGTILTGSGELSRNLAAEGAIVFGLRVRQGALPKNVFSTLPLALEFAAGEEIPLNALNRTTALTVGNEVGSSMRVSTQGVINAFKRHFKTVFDGNTDIPVEDALSRAQFGKFNIFWSQKGRKQPGFKSYDTQVETLVKRIMTGLIKEFSKNDLSFTIVLNRDYKQTRSWYVGDSQGNVVLSLAVRGIFENLKNSYLIKYEGKSIHDYEREGRAYFLHSLGSVLAHEYGHALAFHYLYKAPPAVFNAVIQAYNRKAILAAVARTKPKGYMRPGAFSYMKERSTFEQTLQHKYNSGKNGYGYWTGFDEWIAEQMANYIAAAELAEPLSDPLSRIIKYMAELVNRVWKHTFERLGVDRSHYNPTLEFQRFLQFISEKNSITNAEDIQAVAEEKLREEKYNEEIGVSYSEQPAGIRSQKLMDYVKAKLPKGEQRKLLESTAAGSEYFNTMVKNGWTVLQLAAKVQNQGIVWLQRYVNLARQWYNEKMLWMTRANDTLREWELLGREQADAVGALLFDIDSMVYLSEKDREDPGKHRHPTDAELAALFKKHKITVSGQAVYRQVKNDFRAILLRLKEIALADIKRSGIVDPYAVQLEQKRIDKEFKALLKRPYFPHARFGNFSVVVWDKGKKVVHMEQHETRREAEAARRALLQKAYKEAEGFNIALDRIPDNEKVFRGMPTFMLQQLKNMPQITEAQRRFIDKLIIEGAPSKSFRKHYLNRANIPGYSKDAMRAYADYFWHAANHLARIDYGRQMDDTIEKDARNEIKQLSQEGQNVEKRRAIQDFLRDHLNEIMNPRPDWAQLRSIAFTWWLGFVPASAVLNFTQVPMVAWPYLSSRFGSDIKAANALRKAAGDLRKMYTDPKTLDKTTDATLKLLDIALKQGFLEESQATELAANAGGSTLNRMLRRTATGRFVRWSADMAGKMFSASEKLNRRTVFRAAVELARNDPTNKYLQELEITSRGEFRDLRKQGLTEIEARAFLAGKDAVIRTQFEYAQWARPRFMRGKAGVIFTFFMFTQNMLWFTFNSPGNVRFLLMMVAMGGIMGLPGADDLEPVVNYIGKNLFGKTFDAESEVRKFVIDMFGNSVDPDLLLHGISRNGFGLPAMASMVGIPLPGVDMSGSVGLGRVVPGLREGLQLLTGKGSFDEIAGRTTATAAGASIGIGVNVLKALTDSYLPVTDFKRWEPAMPRAMRNMARAFRLGAEGRERTRGGQTVLEFDYADPYELAELVGLAGGFQPTSLRRTWDRKIALREAVEYWRTYRGMLLNHYYLAIAAKSAEGRADAKDAIKKFNTEVPYNQMRITQETLEESVAERNRIRKMEEAGIPAQKMYRPFGARIKQLFPEETRPGEKRDGIVRIQKL